MTTEHQHHLKDQDHHHHHHHHHSDGKPTTNDGDSSPTQQRLYASNPNKRRRIRVIPVWLEKHALPVGSVIPLPNSINDPGKPVFTKELSLD